jgi:type III secretion system YscI/HrpB-like protein
MADAIQAVAQTVTNSVVHQGPAAPVGVVSGQDLARFEHAMAVRPDGAQPLAVTMNGVPSNFQGTERVRTLGDAIVDGLGQIQDNRQTALMRMTDLLRGKEGIGLSFQDTVRLQYELTMMTIQQDLTTKIADKISQGVQTLFRNQ